jgi:hypothetical protein
MGFSLCWVGVRGKAAQKVRNELGFVLTDKRGAYPKSITSGTEISSGWYVILQAGKSSVASDSALARVSAGCEVVTCFIEDHVMFSRATGWKDGRQVWEISHDSDADVMDIEVIGETP